jgi:hypothetical protein
MESERRRSRDAARFEWAPTTPHEAACSRIGLA